MSLDQINTLTNRLPFVGEQHPTIKQVKKWRAAAPPDNMILLDGIWGQLCTLDLKIEFELIILCPDLIVTEEAAKLADKLVCSVKECYFVSQKVFSKLSDRDDPDGFLSAVRLPQYSPGGIALPESSVVAVLDGLESPGNIGTILRSCDGAGADALFLCNRRARPNHPKLVKSSMGAVLTVPMLEFESVRDCREWLMQNGFSIFLADTRATKCYDEATYTGRSAVVVGNERYGLSKEWYHPDSQLLSIPMNGRCDSLNAGVAASILLYHICRQLHCGKR